jgi:hypothetical protein
MGRWLSKISKLPTSDLTELTQAADLIESVQNHGASFRVTAKREIVLRGSRKLPPDLLEKLRESQKEVRAHVNQIGTAHVWEVVVDSRKVRVVDPACSTRAEFENSMQKQFGGARVGACRRLWPEENRDG